MTIYRVQLTIPSVTGLPEDVVTNVWHFGMGLDYPRTNGNEVSNHNNCNEQIATFYETAFAGQATTQQNWAGAVVKWFDLSQPTPRQPRYETPINITLTTGGDTLPTELAICCSFQATKVSGTPQSRRRNRVYLGPWATSTNSDGRIAGGVITAITNAADELARYSRDDSEGWHWVGYSPTDASAWEVDNGWVDNEWDSQRRRGIRASSRTQWNEDAGVPIP